MLGGVDWGSLHVAGAFVVGVVAGAVAVLRVTRLVMRWLRDDASSHDVESH